MSPQKSDPIQSLLDQAKERITFALATGDQAGAARHRAILASLARLAVKK